MMKNIDVCNIIFFDNNGRFLMQHRSPKSKIYPNHWGLFGGKIDFGENKYIAIKREIKEELGFDLKEEKYLFSIDYEIQDICFGKWYIFTKKILENEKNNMELLDGENWGWFSKKERKNLLINSDLQKILDKVEEIISKNNYSNNK